jgi:hypothetical protein
LVAKAVLAEVVLAEVVLAEVLVISFAFILQIAKPGSGQAAEPGIRASNTIP